MMKFWPDRSSGGPSPWLFTTAGYTIAVSLVCSSIVFLLKKVVRFYERSMKETMVIMPVQNPWLLKLFVMVSTG